MTITEKVRSSPLIAVLTTITLIAGALASWNSIDQYYDSKHITEEELHAILHVHSAQPHESAQAMLRATRQDMEESDRRNQCSNIDVRIALLEDQIWRMNQTNPTAQRVVDLRRKLGNLEEKRRNLNCSEFET